MSQVWGMQLIPMPDAAGHVSFWINADHLVSVQQNQRRGAEGIVLDAEVKVDGLPLHRIPLGEHPDAETADAVFHRFLTQLQTPHSER